MGEYDDIIHEKRPVSYRKVPMERKRRAKQFMAFDALKGYNEAVRKQERIFSPFPALSEDQQEEIDRILRELSCEDEVRVTYFRESPDMRGSGDYLISEGAVDFIDWEKRRLRIGNDEIVLDVVTDIRILEKRDGTAAC